MRAWAALGIVQDALEYELREAGIYEEFCLVAAMPGTGVADDYVECGGIAWTRLATANPSSSFPTPTQNPNNCAYELAIPMEMGILRKAPGVTENFNEPVLPTKEEYEAATQQQLSDMDLMHRAIRRAARHFEDFVLGGYAPVGPQGGSLGGGWTFTVGETGAL